jgi:hypothetical protein
MDKQDAPIHDHFKVSRLGMNRRVLVPERKERGAMLYCPVKSYPAKLCREAFVSGISESKKQ